MGQLLVFLQEAVTCYGVQTLGVMSGGSAAMPMTFCTEDSCH
eukprot:CAMPEP_0173105362 /NCGR_PEP_ID=MMETSP1102-20130122/40059_1 /TAXON_ID=49646 /ORGANISM="Geminigera sp., Strain Caron Lab Isolate" /LENGTH=41 /DNA_ID= /DNA_START= /DNA_END= /DNA_ORIENTATION=